MGRWVGGTFSDSHSKTLEVAVHCNLKAARRPASRSVTRPIMPASYTLPQDDNDEDEHISEMIYQPSSK